MCWNRRTQDAGKLEDAQMPQMRKGDGTQIHQITRSAKY